MDDSFAAMVAVANEAAAERALRNMKNRRPWKPAELAKPFENQFSDFFPSRRPSMFRHADR
jgi:hypothetical protein